MQFHPWEHALYSHCRWSAIRPRPCWDGDNHSCLLPFFLLCYYNISVIFVSSRSYTCTTTHRGVGGQGGSRDCLRAGSEVSECVPSHVWWVIRFDLITTSLIENVKYLLESIQTLYFVVSHTIDMEHIQVYSSPWQSLVAGCWVCAIIEHNELTTWHVTIPISRALGLPLLLIRVVIQCVLFNLRNFDVLLYHT